MSKLTPLLLSLAVIATGCKSNQRPRDATVTVRPVERNDSPAAPAPTPVNIEVRTPVEGQALVGQNVRVSFRRDALGLSSPSFVGVIAAGAPGRSIQLEGIVERASDQWLVLSDGSKSYWIPQAMILVIEVQPLQK